MDKILVFRINDLYKILKKLIYDPTYNYDKKHEFALIDADLR